MSKHKYYILVVLSAILMTANAQTTDTFLTAGNCDMCKARIEKAGKTDHVSTINWDKHTKKTLVKYDADKVSLKEIQQAIADSGHDAGEVKALDEVYDKTHECCQYPRSGAANDIALSNSVDDQSHENSNEVMGVIVSEDGRGSLTPIMGVNVYWLKTPNLVTQTNENGVFKIMHSKGYQKLVLNHPNIRTDTISVTNLHDVIVIHSKENKLEEVVVTRRKKSNYIARLEPIRSEKITGRELFKAACCDLSESFETNASVDVVSSDAATGSKQVQILGLSGIYTQLTVEGLPGPRGFAYPLGLNSISGTWIESINISKGIGSVVNGFENMAGQINVELKKPNTMDKLYFNTYTNNMGRSDVNLNLAHKINSDWSVGLLLHDNFMYNRHMNFSNNGFRDIPVGNLFTGVNRWLYQNSNGIIANFGVKFLHDDRVGGQIDFKKDRDQFTTNNYGLGYINKKIEGFAKIGYVFPTNKHRSIGLQLSASDYQQNSFFGFTVYSNEQRSAYANLIFQDIIQNEEHKYKVGASMQYDGYDENLDYHSTKYNFFRKESVTGLFGEYTYSPSDRLDVVLGLRQDYNNLYGWFTTPRAVVRYEPINSTTVRLTSGRGQRTANIFAENLGIFASSRTINNLSAFQSNGKAYGLKPEVSWNTGFSVDQSFKLFGREASASVELFHSNFKNQVVVDYENPREIDFYNLNGKSFSNSLQTEFHFMPAKHFEARFAYRLLDVMTTYRGGFLAKPLLAKHRGFMNLGYNTDSGWSFDYTLNVIGPKRLPNTQLNPDKYRLRENSPSYATMNAQVSKTLGKNKNFDIYIGGENLTNYFQKDPIVAANEPFGSFFDTNMLWGPLTGRMFYTGIRYTIK